MSESDVREATDQFYRALNRMLKGDMGAMEEVWSHAEDVTNMDPFGGRQVGWETVRAQLQREARLKLAGTVITRDLLVRSGEDMGFSICVEEGSNFQYEGTPIAINHRATNIFRRENGEWKLIHHQTDLAQGLTDTAGRERAEAQTVAYP